MEQALQDFRRRLLLATHLQPFLQNTPFVIKLEVKEKKDYFLLTLADGTVHITKNEHREDVDLVIQGDEQALLRIVNGRDRLQRLQKRNQITMQGKYSEVLKAETVFYLNQ